MSLKTAEDPTPQAADGNEATLPGGIKPLWKQDALETYYGVSNWTVNQWIQQGMPVEPIAIRGRRFDIDRVRSWMATSGLPASA